MDEYVFILQDEEYQRNGAYICKIKDATQEDAKTLIHNATNTLDDNVIERLEKACEDNGYTLRYKNIDCLPVYFY